MKVNMSFRGEQENMPMSFANGNDRLAMDFGVMQSGGGGVGLPPGGSAGQFLRKNSSTDYDASWLDGDVFWATYNETSYADIRAAYDAGKTVLLHHPDDITIPLKQFGHDDFLESDFVEFYGVVGFANPYVYYARCDASENFWTRSRMLLATNSKIGNLGDLTTSAKNSVVSAINEVNGKSGLPAGGAVGDVMMKRSSSDGDAEWVTPADTAEQDNTRPITAAAVYTEIGNINALLATI